MTVIWSTHVRNTQIIHKNPLLALILQKRRSEATHWCLFSCPQTFVGIGCASKNSYTRVCHMNSKIYMANISGSNRFFVSAKKMGEKMNKQKVIEHLMFRPISLVRIPTERESDVGLKVMCVVDYYLDHHSLYPKIRREPKLLEQLLRFNNFASFKYYKYCHEHKFGLKEMLLKCEHCELIGRSEDVLEHMVLSHGLHKSMEFCYWCGDSTMQSHIDSNTLEDATEII